MKGIISSATDERLIENSEAIYPGTKYNVTQPNTKNYYLVLRPEPGFRLGEMKATILFKYYKYDPGCPQFTNWNGKECKPDYDAYCKSLSGYYQQVYQNPNITVTYNGAACVVNKPQIVENKVIVNVTVTTKPNISTNIIPKNKTIVIERGRP